MWKDSSYRLAVVFAIILHILLITAFFLHINASDLHQVSVQPDVDIIKAVAVSQSDLTKIAQQRARQQQEAQAAAEQQRLQQQAEQKARLAAIQEQQRQQQLQAMQRQREIKEKQAQLVAQQQAEQQAKQKAIQQQEALQQQQAQQAKQAALEKAQKAQKETLKKQQQEKQQADQLKVAEQKALDSQLAAEQKAMTAARTNEQQSELQKYKALIEAAIQQNWVVPGGSNADLSCELTIKLGPGGTVLSVQVTRSSGDSGLDNSARAAVFKASPLPVPADADLASQFRELRLTASPKNIAEQ